MAFGARGEPVPKSNTNLDDSYCYLTAELPFRSRKSAKTNAKTKEPSIVSVYGWLLSRLGIFASRSDQVFHSEVLTLQPSRYRNSVTAQCQDNGCVASYIEAECVDSNGMRQVTYCFKSWDQSAPLLESSDLKLKILVLREGRC